MARIKIDLPTSKVADLSIPVRISDINYGNHVGNDAFVSIIHDARLQWLNQYHFSELDFGGVGLIMSDIAIEFKSESFYGDFIQVEIYVGEISRVSFDLYYRLTAIRNERIFLLALAKTGMLTYNYETKKPVSIPAVSKDILSKII